MELVERYGFCRNTWTRWLALGRFPHAVHRKGILTLIPSVDVKMHLRNRTLRLRHGRAGLGAQSQPSVEALNGRP
jgi:hypothetical protein